MKEKKEWRSLKSAPRDGTFVDLKFENPNFSDAPKIYLKSKYEMGSFSYVWRFQSKGCLPIAGENQYWTWRPCENIIP